MESSDKKNEEEQNQKEVIKENVLTDDKLNNISKIDENKLDNNNMIDNVKILNLDNNTNFDIDYSFKVIIIGNSFVGKSSIVHIATKNTIISDKYNPTIGFDYFSFYIEYNSKNIKLQIWDTCGQEAYKSLITNFYRNSSLAIMIYAINDKKSFEDLDMWLKEIKTRSNPDTKIILIGNKIDLESERVVSHDEAVKFAQDYNFIKYYETSAKTGFNIKNVFVQIAILLYEDYMKNRDVYSDYESSTVKSKLRRNTKTTKNGCC